MWLADNFKQSTCLGYLAIPRILVGYHFLNSGWPKAFGGRFLGGSGLAAQLLAGAPEDPIALHREFILGFVVPHAHFFSYLVAFGEVAIGISLVLGCLVRISSAFGAFHNLNIYLAMAIPGGGASVGLNRIFIALHLVFVAASAGRALGLDAILHRWFPRSRLF